MTYSFLINYIIKIYNQINVYYEKSKTYALICRIGNSFKGSIAYAKAFNIVCIESKTQYVKNSVFFQALYKIVGFFSRISTLIFKSLNFEHSAFAKAVSHSAINFKGMFLENSLCVFIFVMCIMPHGFWNNLLILAAALALVLILIAQVALNPLKRKFSFKNISASLIIYTMLGFLNILTSVARGDTIRIFALLFSCILISIVTQAAASSKRGIRLVVVTLLLAAFVSALYGIYEYKVGVGVRLEFVDTLASGGLSRLFATMDNPNNYAEFLIMMFPLAFAFLLNLKTDTKRFLVIITMSVCLLALVLTYSRSSYLALVVSGAVFVLLINKRLVPFFIVIGIALIPVIPTAIINRILTIGKDSSSYYRLMIWEGAGKTLRNNWLFGIGIGPAAFAKEYKYYAIPVASPAMHSHNLLFQAWLEMGILGIISFVAFLASTIKKAIVTCRKTVDLEIKYYSAAACAALCGVLFISLFEYIWFYPRIMALFWIVVGLVRGVGQAESVASN